MDGEGDAKPLPLVLLVADEPAAAELFREAARERLPAEFEVIEHGAQAATRLRAIAAGHAPRPTLVLLDLEMPGAAGERFVRLAKGDPATADIPVVLLTDGDPRALDRDCLPDDYIAKPLAWEQYVAMMDFLADVLAPPAR